MPTAYELMKSGFGTRTLPHLRPVGPLTDGEYAGGNERDEVTAQLSCLLHQVKPKERVLLRTLQYRVPPDIFREFLAEQKRKSPNLRRDPLTPESFAGIHVLCDDTLTDIIILEKRP